MLGDRAVSVVISDCKFINGTAGMGGGVYLDTRSRLVNVEISGNTAEWGGGIAVVDAQCGKTSSEFQNVTVRGNHAYRDGGGVHANAGSVSMSPDVVIENNSADRDGGGVFATCAPLVCLDYVRNDCLDVGLDLAAGVVVRGNKAQRDGGGIHAGDVDVMLAAGGANNGSAVTLAGNTAEGRGGAVFGTLATRWAGGSGAVVAAANVSGNTAGVYGNAFSSPPARADWVAMPASAEVEAGADVCPASGCRVAVYDSFGGLATTSNVVTLRVRACADVCEIGSL